VRFIRLGLVFPLLALSLACSTTALPDRMAAHRDAWVAGMGGVATGHGQLIADQAISRLRGDIRVTLLDCAEPGAFAWPDGRIFVSRGLVELLDADELTASLAHELGHLILSGRLTSPVALAGNSAAIGLESRADDIARSLLPAAGLGSDTLARALRKVRDHLPPGDPRRAAMDERIRRVEIPL
jgi:hypothetical protein